MQTVIEVRRLFLQELARQAPWIVFDLFERDDAQAWARKWRILSQWVINHAERALFCRGGNRAQMRTERERGVRDDILRAWKAEEWRAWMSATHSARMPDPLRLVINVFDGGEDFQYLTPDEVWARVEGDIRARRRRVPQGHL